MLTALNLQDELRESNPGFIHPPGPTTCAPPHSPIVITQVAQPSLKKGRTRPEHLLRPLANE